MAAAPCSRSTTSTSPSTAPRSCAGSACRSARARSTRSWAPTARASRPSPTRSWPTPPTRSPRARSASGVRTSPPSPPTTGRPGDLPRLPAPRGDLRGQRPQLPAPVPGRAQGHPGPVGPRGPARAHGLDEAPRHGRPLPGALPERGLLRRREEAQRDPPDGDDGTRFRGARRDRQRSRHRCPPHRRRRHRRSAQGPARARHPPDHPLPAHPGPPRRPTSCTCCSTAGSSPPAGPSSPGASRQAVSTRSRTRLRHETSTSPGSRPTSRS